MSKCFQKNFDKTCKVSANNFKPFWRLKQNVHWVPTKCNFHKVECALFSFNYNGSDDTGLSR